jgi:hypothetical protein
MATLFNRFWIVLFPLVLQTMPHDLWSQVVRPETVFHCERIAAGNIRMVRIVTTGRLTGKEVEFYHFDQQGRLIAITGGGDAVADTLYGRSYDRDRVSEQQAQRPEGLRRELLQYDDKGRLVKKLILNDDTLFSAILLRYGDDGLLLFSAEINPGGDTLRTAQYHYIDSIVVSITYTGATVGRMEYFRQRRHHVTRAFSPEGDLLMTRTEQYGRHRLLKRETVSVPGVGAIPPTKYRYRSRLLRKIIHPDGSKSRVKYFTAEDSFPALGRKLFSGHHQFLSE